MGEFNMMTESKVYKISINVLFYICSHSEEEEEEEERKKLTKYKNEKYNSCVAGPVQRTNPMDQFNGLNQRKH